jgi:diguanylate cyclase (GGDEF)-like protein/PAS domain S-box-containing protein
LLLALGSGRVQLSGDAAAGGVGVRILRLTSIVIAVVSVVAYVVLPSIRPAMVAVISVASAVGVFVGAACTRSPRRATWFLVGVAVTLVGAGDVALASLGNAPPATNYPRLPDLLYLAAYLPLGTALMWWGRSRTPGHNWSAVLDTVVLTLAGTLLVWYLLVRPALLELDLSRAGRATLIGNWVGSMVVLAGAIRVVFVRRINLPIGLLETGVAAFLVADFFYSYALLRGSWVAGAVVVIGYLAFPLLAWTAALTPWTADKTRAGGSPEFGPGRFLAVAAALLVAPTLLFVQASSGPVTAGVAIAVVSAAAGVAVVLRLWLAVRASQRRAGWDRAARVAARDLLRATTEDDVTGVLTEALEAMVPAGSRGSALVTQSKDSDAASHPSNDDRTPEPDHRGKLAFHAGTTGLPVVAPDGSLMPDADRRLVFSAAADLGELEPVLASLADQAGLTLDRIGEVARSREVERERYFRTLVRSNIDVTLISRDGRIEYATPSAEGMFDHEVINRRFDDLVHPDRKSASSRAWADHEDGAEAFVDGPQGRVLTVVVHRRDLTDDPTVGGVVSTLRDVTAERELQRDLTQRATHDALTGLANADLFAAELQSVSSAGTAPAAGWAVVYIDLDDFKDVNDSYGHEAGDELLTETARRITWCLRRGDLAARVGGDEFAVLLRDVPDTGAAQMFTQRLTDALAGPARVAGALVDCQASVGLSHTGSATDVESLRGEADRALYAAKAVGKGHWRQYHEMMPPPSRQKVDARRQLTTAIESNRLRVLYQPIVEIGTGEVVGFEALIRDAADIDQPMTARELIDTAEQTGLTTTLGDWVLDRAIRDAATLNACTARPRYVSINVAARQLRQHHFVDTIRHLIAAHRVDPSLLVLEITEDAFVADDAQIWADLDALRQLGLRVAVDDYGTGNASASYLRQTKIDIIKLDQSFVAGLHHHRERVLLQAMIWTCTQLGLDHVAEGIEDDTTRDRLVEYGCRYGQGFLYAHAMPVERADRCVHFEAPTLRAR